MIQGSGVGCWGYYRDTEVKVGCHKGLEPVIIDQWMPQGVGRGGSGA